MSLIIKGDIIGLGDSSVIEDLQIVDDTLLDTVSKTDLKDDQNFALAKENLINPVIDTTSTVHEVAANVLESYTDLVADDYTLCTNIIDGLASTPSAHRRSQRTRKSTPSKSPR